MEITPDIALEILEKARSRGITEGEILIVEGQSSSVHVRLKSVDTIKDSSSRKLGLRFFYGKRCAITSTTDLSPSSIENLIDETCTLAKLTATDEYSGLAMPAGERISPMELYDNKFHDISLEEMTKMAQIAEESALNYDRRITNSDGSSFTKRMSSITYANSRGFASAYRVSLFSITTIPVASMDGTMQRDYWYSTRRQFDKLEDPESIGKEAARRTIRRLGARKISTTQGPVIFDPETASTLLNHLATVLSGYSVYKGASFLAGFLGKEIASPHITIWDDGTIPWGLGSRPFDTDGIPSRKNIIVENGVLQTYLLDTYSARKLGLTTTGNAYRSPDGPPSVGPTNFYLNPGPYSPDEIIRSVKSGLYVTELIGFGFNPATGDYSRGAVGIWIENGELAYPVEEITIAGNLKDMLMNIEMVGNDLSFRDRISAPTIKIGKMIIAGH